MKITIYIAMPANGLISNSRNVRDWLSPESFSPPKASVR